MCVIVFVWCFDDCIVEHAVGKTCVERMATNQVVKVRRESLAACMTCPLCQDLLDEATTVTECLHTCMSFHFLRFLIFFLIFIFNRFFNFFFIYCLGYFLCGLFICFTVFGFGSG